MSSDLGMPVAPTRGRMHRRDWARLKHYRERRNEVDDPLEAFTEVALHPGHGVGEWAGKPSIPRPTLARLWARFCERVAPDELATSKAAVALDASSYAPAAWRRVKALVDGDFGEAKVWTKQNGEEVVEVDAAAAGVQLAAAKFALGAIGLGDKRSPVAEEIAQRAVNIDARSFTVILADPALAAGARSLGRALLEGRSRADDGVDLERPIPPR